MEYTIGIFDLGSNALRFTQFCKPLMAGPSMLRPWPYALAFHRYPISILADYTDGKKIIRPKTQQNIIEAISKSLATARVSKIQMVASEACRIAENFSELSDAIQKRFDIEIKLIDFKEEANLSVQGIRLVHQSTLNGFFIEVGGGSMQLNWIENLKQGEPVSMPYGSRALLMRYQNGESISSLFMEVKTKLLQVFRNFQYPDEWLNSQDGISLYFAGGGTKNLLQYIQNLHNLNPLEDKDTFSLTASSYKAIISDLWRTASHGGNLEHDELFSKEKLDQAPMMILLQYAIISSLEDEKLFLKDAIMTKASVSLGLLHEFKPPWFSITDPWENFFKILFSDLDERRKYIRRNCHDVILPPSCPSILRRIFPYILIAHQSKPADSLIRDILTKLSDWCGASFSDKLLFLSLSYGVSSGVESGICQKYFNALSDEELKCWIILSVKLASFLLSNDNVIVKPLASDSTDCTICLESGNNFADDHQYLQEQIEIGKYKLKPIILNTCNAT